MRNAAAQPASANRITFPKKAVTDHMTFPRGRLLPGIFCLCALLAVGCGTESGLESQQESLPEITAEPEISTLSETTADTTTAETAELTVPVTTTEQTTSETTEPTTVTAATTATTVTTLTSVTTLSASTTLTTASIIPGTLPSMTWWTPPPMSSTTVFTTTTVTGATIDAPAGWQTTAATTAKASADYALTDSDRKFLDGCVFVGDSICSGLRVYKILPANHVLAKGSVGVRNIYTFKFTVGKYETDVLTAIKSQNPKRVIFSMGMNDINMTTAKQYCSNYQNLLTDVQKALPSAQLYVASITPIAADSTFSTNTKIDTYNATLQSFLSKYPGWTYVDVTKEMKNQWNGLKSEFSGGDGIHLSPAAYQAYLWQICQQLNV